MAPEPADGCRGIASPLVCSLVLNSSCSGSPDAAAVLASRRAYSFAAAALLAVRHFNERNASIVPSLSRLDETCDFQLQDPVFVDSQNDATSSVRHLWDWASTSAAAADAIKPCALLGPHTVEATRNLEAAAIAMGVPLVNYYNDNERGLDQGSNTIGLTLPAGSLAQATVSFLKQYDTVATWSSKGPFDISIVDEIELLASEDEGLKIVQFNAGAETEDWASERLRESGITYILVDLSTVHELSRFASTVDSLGMLAPEYSYILPSDLTHSESLSLLDFNETAVSQSSLFRLLDGAITFDRVDSAHTSKDKDPFTTTWQQMDNATIAALQSMIPTSALYKGDKSFFETNLPSRFSSLIYNSVVVIGMGGCLSQRTTAPSWSPMKQPTPQPTRRPTKSPTSAPIPKKQLPLTFNFIARAPTDPPTSTFAASRDEPTSGRLLGLSPLFPTNRRSLQQEPVLVDGIAAAISDDSLLAPVGNQSTTGTNNALLGLYNIRPQVLEEEDGKKIVSFEPVLVQSFSEAMGWVVLDGERIIYRDGSDQRSVGRKIKDYHYLSGSVRGLGLGLLAGSWLCSLSAFGAVWVLRKDNVVQRAQPFFLMLLCVGSFIMSASIFTLSWDEQMGFSTSQLSQMCMATPWLFFLGEIVIFCALFTKLWRVDEVLQFRRRAVTLGNVAAPTIAVLLLAVGILMAWTVADPWSWERQLVREIPAESFAKCSSRHFWIFFGPLAGLVFLTQAISLYFSWKTADIPTDFRDSNPVMYASFAQFQSWVVGIPMLAVIGNTSSDGTYLGRTLLIFLFAVSSVVVVVWPKIFKAIELRRHPERKRKGRVSVTGLVAQRAEASAVSVVGSQITQSSTARKEQPKPQLEHGDEFPVKVSVVSTADDQHASDHAT